MSQLDLPIKRIDASLDMPSYAYPGDAGLDLRAAERAVIAPQERAVVRCGIAVAIPRGHAGLVIPRSGLAAKHGITIVNAPGLIDSDYRGEIMAILANLDKEHAFEINKGDRIAQLVIVEIPTVNLLEVDELDDTERGKGGFGSSGLRS